MPINLLTFLLLILVAGSAAFSLLTIIAAELYLSVRPPSLSSTDLPPLSVLKPLHGWDEGLEQNLLGFFQQDYPAFEILFAVEEEQDRAVPLVRQLIEEHPAIPARLLIAGLSQWPNAKVHSLQCMVAASDHELIVMADSDVRVSPDFLRIVAAEMTGPNVALVTCPYRAIAGNSRWSQLEALGLNTEFIAGVLVARLLGGMNFALGPSIVTRKAHLEEIAGLADLQQYLAEDFVMGKRLADRGHRVVLSSCLIEHRIGSQSLGVNLSHRLRWSRSTRRSRPLGYVGQIFTHPLPIALTLVSWNPRWWTAALATIVVRYAAAWRASCAIGTKPSYMWLPVQDMLSVAVWLAGFFGNRIVWRNRSFTIDRLGRFQASNEGVEIANETDRT